MFLAVISYKNSLRIYYYVVDKKKSSRGGLEVEQWSDNRTFSISVDRMPFVNAIWINSKELMLRVDTIGLWCDPT